MRDDFINDLKALFEEQANTIKNKVMSKDEEMIKLNKKVTEMDKIFYDMIENLDEEKQEIAEKYISVLNDRFAYKIQYFYMNGFKNCLKFLFCIGMFSYEESLLDE